MKWFRGWSEFWNAENSYELDTAELLSALNSPAVRSHWLASVLDQLRQLNLDVDKALVRGDTSARLLEIAARRRQLVGVLQQIDASKQSQELERDHNQDAGQFDAVAVEPAPGI